MAFGNATKGYVKSHGGGGGGGGSNNYNNATNKPQINGVELVGNKTSNDLGIGARTLLNQKPITNVGDTAIDISQYKYIEIVSGIYAAEAYQVFTNFVSVDTLTSDGYELICGGCHPNDPNFSLTLLIKAVNNILNIVALRVRGWSETPTIYKIVGIK